MIMMFFLFQYGPTWHSPPSWEVLILDLGNQRIWNYLYSDRMLQGLDIDSLKINFPFGMTYFQVLC